MLQEDDKLVLAFENSLRLLALPLLEFPGYHVAFVQHLPER